MGRYPSFSQQFLQGGQRCTSFGAGKHSFQARHTNLSCYQSYVGDGHGDPRFNTGRRIKDVQSFLERYLMAPATAPPRFSSTRPSGRWAPQPARLITWRL